MTKKESILIAVFLVSVGIVSRFLPHAWNFAPITAITLFASAYLGIRYSLVILFSTLAVSDFFLGTYNWPVMVAVYVGFALAALAGQIMKTKKTPALIFASVFLSSVIFFLLTNWAVWQFSGMYAHTFTGLIDSYVMAIPFFRNSLGGDLFYTGLLFGGFEFARYAARNIARRLASRENHADFRVVPSNIHLDNL